MSRVTVKAMLGECKRERAVFMHSRVVQYIQHWTRPHRGLCPWSSVSVETALNNIYCLCPIKTHRSREKRHSDMNAITWLSV